MVSRPGQVSAFRACLEDSVQVFTIAGVERLELHHLYRAMAWSSRLSKQ